MTRNLIGRRILVTGASSGIGRCLANELSALGARLVLVARSDGRLNELARSLNRDADDVVVVPADITRESDRQKVLDQTTARMGGLDVLVNNAGIASWAHFADSSEVILRQIMEVNFFAPAELIRMAIPMLVNGNQAAVVNVASMCGRRAMPAWSEYSASKYALCGLTEALRAELSRFDIDVLLMVPGLTRGEFPLHFLRSEGRAKIEFDRGMPPELVAARIVRSLRNNRNETVIGGDARWILRVHRYLPRLVDRLLARKVQKLYAQGM